MKKIISMILCAVMVLSCFAGVSFAVEAAQSRAIKNSIFIYRDGMFTENIDENDNVFYANTYALENGEHMPIYTESSNYDVGLYVNITYNYKTGYIKKMTKVDSTTFTADAVDSDGDSNDAFYLSVASANENVIITDGGILDLAGNAYEVAEDITIFLIEGTAYSKISLNKLASLSQKGSATYAGVVNAEGQVTDLYVVYTVGDSGGSGSTDSGSAEYTIKKLALRDEITREELPSIPAGNFLAEVTVQNNSSSNMDTILLATYDEDGGMLGLTYLYTNIDIGKTALLGTLIKNDGSVAKVKAFVLDSLLGLHPVATAFEITKN